MFKGLRTCIFHVAELAKAREWYTKVLEKKLYFDQTYYVGFNVGGNILVASVFDPFGNILGIIKNPHFKIEDS
jgi:hypothetical protein